ncbi:MAG TPA: polysaccharide deacetylase family protein [Gaiellaceae bacterium]|nr:polysaccharide deacetylase family protein [Gaiellaceae bacterium]
MRQPDHRRLTPALAAGGASVVTYWLPSVALVSRRARLALGIRATISAADAVALTFDDGPHPEATPAVLELLARHELQATFFLVGEQVERRPELARRIAAAGHEVAVHCHRHRNLMRLAPAQVRADVDRAAAAIEEATGTAPRRYRPPYGIVTLPALRLAQARGWETVLWTRHGADWAAAATPESIAARLLGDAAGGDILLLHDSDAYSTRDSWRRTVAALPLVLDRLDALGLRVAPLD